MSEERKVINTLSCHDRQKFPDLPHLLGAFRSSHGDLDKNYAKKNFLTKLDAKSDDRDKIFQSHT